MSKRRFVGLLLTSSLAATSARAEERSQPTYEITFERAMQLALRRGPDLATAQARVGEARGRLDAASIWRFNPQIDGAVGSRFGAADTTVDWSVGARQWLEIGGQRGRRIDGARAGVDVAEAQADNAERLLLRDVGLAFVQALYWGRRVELAQENLRIAEEIARVARRRHEVGDTGGLEESVASLSLTRTEIGRAQVQAALGQAQGRLKILLGLEADAQVSLQGDLRQFGMSAEVVARADVSGRPDLRALTASIRRAESEAELGRAARIPNIALGADYSREEEANIIQGSLTVTLPFFDHGQGTTAISQARRARIETELHGEWRRAEIEIETARGTFRRLSAAARHFEERGLATLERSERVATATYEAGAIPLGGLLAVRGELVQAKLDYSDLLLGVAIARVELTASTGGAQ